VSRAISNTISLYEDEWEIVNKRSKLLKLDRSDYFRKAIYEESKDKKINASKTELFLLFMIVIQSILILLIYWRI
jgi:hypothetical protein